MGIYPLLEDDSCWFLAIDFDKGTWKQDISAVANTCRKMDFPVAVERSRSGDGAHVWFFFKTPVAARVARQFGCFHEPDEQKWHGEWVVLVAGEDETVRSRRAFCKCYPKRSSVLS